MKGHFNQRFAILILILFWTINIAVWGDGKYYDSHVTAWTDPRPDLTDSDNSIDSQVFSTVANIPFPTTGPRGVAINSTTNRIYVADLNSNRVSVIDGNTDTVVATVNVGSNPLEVGVNRVTNRIYISNFNGNSVSVIDGNTNNVIATIPVGINPRGVGINPITNRIYVANFGNNNLSVIDGNTNTVIDTVGVGNAPSFVEVNPNTDRVYVNNINGASVSVINGSSNSLVATVNVGNSPIGIGVNTTTNRIYISNFNSNTISVIDGNSNSVIATIGVGANPAGVGANPTNNLIYVANLNNDTVFVINGTNNTIIKTVNVGRNPGAVAVNAITNRIYNSNINNDTVTVIDGNNNNNLAVTINVGVNPLGLAVNSSTNQIYAANYNTNSLSVINGNSNSVTTAVNVGKNPRKVAVNQTTNLIYTSNSNSNTISVINGSTNTVTTTVNVGANPDGVAVNTTTNLIYVANFNSNTISVINGGNNILVATVNVGNNPGDIAVNRTTNRIYVANSTDNSVSIIDGSSNSVVAVVNVGSGPRGIAVDSATNRVYVANFNSNTISVIDGNSSNVIATINVGANPLDIALNSVTSRIYVTNSNSSSFSVIDGNSNTIVETVGVGIRPSGVGVNTTTERIYIANAFDNTISVITPPSLPTITSFSPTSGQISTNVTITGTGLTDATSVAFNGMPAPILSNTDTQIITTVPNNAGTGTITITTTAGTATSASNFIVTNPTALPVINSFSPTAGAVGTSVTILGANFTAVSLVKFNTANALFTVISDTEISATVPSTATTGLISVNTANGTAISELAFTIVSRPTVTTFSPLSGPVGTVVTINGSNLNGVNSVKFNGVEASLFTPVSNNQIKATVAAGTTTGTITVSKSGVNATTTAQFKILPGIISFNPTASARNSSVIITGTNFTGVTSVRFNNIVAAFTINSDSQITTTVPATATTGKISISNINGATISATNFTVILPPTISNFQPAAGASGTIVTINGTNLSGLTSVKFNDTPASSIIPISASQIKATVPVGAATGKISVANIAGSAFSTNSFKVLPGIVSFTPTSGIRGSVVTITGTDLNKVTLVKFNNLSAPFTINSSTEITATVPNSATTGKISVTSVDGSTSSLANFTVILPPTIISFTPTTGQVGTVVTINGSNLGNITGVLFNGTAAITITPVSATQIRVVVPSGVTTGKITVSNAAGSAVSLSTFRLL